jgi:hypothetical protein
MFIDSTLVDRLEIIKKEGMARESEEMMKQEFNMIAVFLVACLAHEFMHFALRTRDKAKYPQKMEKRAKDYCTQASDSGCLFEGLLLEEFLNQ